MCSVARDMELREKKEIMQAQEKSSKRVESSE